MAERDDELTGKLPHPDEDFSAWYVQVVRRARLADYTPVRGCMAIRPYGYAIWEQIQAHLDRRFKATGHVNAYFPLLVPESLLQKEAAHVEGFAPQVAWVTQGGDERLEERLAIRPTSEAIIGAMYSRWIDSWRDLPVLINQWCNVMRWEKVTRPFLRTTEFLWQEGHTVHRTEEEAEAETLQMLGVYRDFLETELAIPVIPGQKTESEKFPGALRTYTVEALMRDGRALQAATAHNLGQHFSRVFDITFQDMDGERKYAWQTSWGATTRLIGATVMVHGDASGLILPPNVAPVQIVIVPIWRGDEEKALVMAATDRVLALLQPICRVEADRDESKTPGWKYNEHELRGVPVRLEIGPRDVRSDSVVLVRRLNRAKETVPIAHLAERVPILLREVQQEIFARARQFRDENTHHVRQWEEFRAIMDGPRGFIVAAWCGDAACERAIQEETTATIRCLPLDRPRQVEAPCVRCGRPGQEQAVFAKAY